MINDFGIFWIFGDFDVVVWDLIYDNFEDTTSKYKFDDIIQGLFITTLVILLYNMNRVLLENIHGYQWWMDIRLNEK